MKYMIRQLNFLVVLLGVICVVTSCQDNSLTYRISGAAEKSSIEPVSVKLYLETSVSMKGYVNYNKAGDYKLMDALPYFITDMQANDLPVELYTITDAPKRYDKSVGEFYDDLRTGGIFTGKSSMLHNIFERLIGDVDSASVNILVSDCILDLGSENNMSERSQMTLEIYRHLNPNISAACFKFLSDFNGDCYYDRENTGGLHSGGVKKPYAGKILHKRPYYIWMFGDGKLIEKIHEDGSLKGYESVHFYNIDFDDTPVKLLSHPRKGHVEISTDKKEFTIEGASTNEPVEITVGLNLKAWPKTYQDIGYLRKNISIKPDYAGTNCNVNVCDVEEIKKDKRDYAKIERVVVKEGLTHFVILSFSDSDMSNDSFQLIFSKEKPDWLTESHLDDDLNQPEASIEGKTFSFGQLIDAFDRRYKNEELLRVNFELMTNKH